MQLVSERNRPLISDKLVEPRTHKSIKGARAEPRPTNYQPNYELRTTNYELRIYSTKCGYSRSNIARYFAYTGFVIGISASAFFTSPAVLMRLRANAIAMFSSPWK